MKKIWLALSWLFGLGFILLGFLIFIAEAGSLISLYIFIIGALLTPLTRNWLNKIFKINISVGVRSGLILLLLCVAIFSILDADKSTDDISKDEAELAQEKPKTAKKEPEKSKNKSVLSSLFREKYDIYKIVRQNKQAVDDYLMAESVCEVSTYNNQPSNRCEYQDEKNTHVTFVKDEAVFVKVNNLNDVPFDKKALKEVGIKKPPKPDFQNNFTINFNYIKGLDVTILPDENKNVHYILFKPVPLTITYVASAGRKLEHVIPSMLANTYEKIKKINTPKNFRVFLSMNGLVDEYGNDKPTRIIHTFEYSLDDFNEFTKYKNSSQFYSDQNNFHVKAYDDLFNGGSPSFYLKFWLE